MGSTFQMVINACTETREDAFGKGQAYHKDRRSEQQAAAARNGKLVSRSCCGGVIDRYRIAVVADEDYEGAAGKGWPLITESADIAGGSAFS